MNELSADEREVLFVYYWCDMNDAEVARELGISTFAAKKRRQRAQLALEKIMASNTSAASSGRKPGKP
jgi:DNA-directed RNA polymerase specialized sigma24 family protein